MAERIYVKVHKVTGKCRFWKEGDEIVFIVDYKSRMIGLDMEATKRKAACVISLAMMYPYIITPRSWSTGQKNDRYACPDPGPDWDGCGNVIFEVDRGRGK